MKRRERYVDVKKVAIFNTVVSVLQILMLIVMAWILASGGYFEKMGRFRYILAVGAVMITVGAVLSISDAANTRKLLDQLDAMDQSMTDLESLNNTLRAQRHDFLNHLQVVFSLMEMGENEEANRYIEKVYGEITSVSRALKTANPAINALLQVKLAACEKAGIRSEVNINSSWKDLPIPGWEMCKVLSNLIDNAIDALMETEDKRLTIVLTEDLKAFRFAVANSGPQIPVQSQEHIFEAGVTTKAEGHGMGLYIVRQTLRSHGGEISLSRDGDMTVFSGYIPREIIHQDAA